MMENPFSLEFGVQPPEYIERFSEISQIKEDFTSLLPPTHVYAILGPRGCGKTVMMNDLYDSFEKKDDWIVVALNCKSDLLLQLAAALDDKVKSAFPHISPEFSFSFSFFSLTIKGKEKVSSLSVLLEKMFASLAKHNMKVLITIDDIVNNDYVAVFAKEFQSLRGRKMPIFLVMTGLFSVFNHVQSQEGLTFLQRSAKIYLGPLNRRAIAESYRSILGINESSASELANFTKGYAFAYQCLGYLLVKEGKKAIDENVLAKITYYLEEGVYSKLADELTPKEKEILLFLAENGASPNAALIEAGILNSGTVANYKSSLERKGVIEPLRGVFSIALPRFGEYLLER